VLNLVQFLYPYHQSLRKCLYIYYISWRNFGPNYSLKGIERSGEPLSKASKQLSSHFCLPCEVWTVPITYMLYCGVEYTTQDGGIFYSWMEADRPILQPQGVSKTWYAHSKGHPLFQLYFDISSMYMDGGVNLSHSHYQRYCVKEVEHSRVVLPTNKGPLE